MAGIYVHIPFCRQACRYCDFYFTVSLKYIDGYIASLKKEIQYKSKKWGEQIFSTLYIGGGTPSVFKSEQILEIISLISKHYKISEEAEITLEANPDDLTPSYLNELTTIGINRLSIGIQSFQEKDLQLLRRSHDSKQAINCLLNAEKTGFKNINIDLIYGIPELSNQEWNRNIEKALQLPVKHISAYHLTYEPGTVFHHWMKKGRIIPSPEEKSLQQYEALRIACKKEGFEHYEISNFAKEGYRSKHNSSYWTGENYLGFGPSAHSFLGEVRSWNVSSLKQYIQATEEGNPCSEFEKLTLKDQYHDYLITSLRRKEGLSKKHIESVFGKRLLDEIEKRINSYTSSEVMEINDDTIRITEKSWLISDSIIKELMVEDENLFT